MIVRPLGLLGPKYKVNETGKKHHINAWIFAILGCVYVATIGLFYVDNLRELPVLFLPGILILLLLTIRSVVLTIRNGERSK